jgi:hypothetical protein
MLRVSRKEDGVTAAYLVVNPFTRPSYFVLMEEDMASFKSGFCMRGLSATLDNPAGQGVVEICIFRHTQGLNLSTGEESRPAWDAGLSRHAKPKPG